MSGATIDGVTPPQFAPGNVPEEYFGEAPKTVGGSRELATGSGAPQELGGPRVEMPSNIDLSDPNLSDADFERARPAIEARQNELQRQQANQQRVAAIDEEANARRKYEAEVAARNRPDALRLPSERDPEPPREIPTGPTGPSEKDALMAIAAKGDKREEQKRVDKLLTERSRARRGLPPIDAEARAALSDPEAAKAYRAGPAAPPAAQPGQAGQTPAAPGQVPQPGQAASGPPKGGYQTGQTVQLTGMPGGQTSTQVYSMGNGIALPDGQGMSSQDFMQAFEQVNPGKTPVDAIQALSREPGATGNAARKILRDIGATGGANLTAEQQSQVEEALSGKTGELLRGHARGMSKGITSGADRISRAEEKRQEELRKNAEENEERKRKREEELRKKALAAAEKRFQDPDNFKSRATLIEEEYATAMSARSFIEGGKPGDVEGRDPNRTTLDAKQITRKVDNIPAGQPEVSFNDQGLLEYQAEGLPNKLPAAMVEAEGIEGGRQVVPVLQNERQVDFLKPGQAYLDENGQLHLKGTVGRPKNEGGPGGTRGSGSRTRTRDPLSPESGREENPGFQVDFNKVGQELTEQREKENELPLEDLVEEASDAATALQNAKSAANANKDESKAAEYQTAIDEAQKNAEFTKQQLTKARENLSKPVTNEEIRAEVERRRAEYDSRAAAERDFRFDSGDPEVVTQRINDALSESTQRVVTPTGNAFVFGDTTVPASPGDAGLPAPSNTNEIAALERSSRGNVPVAQMGADGPSATSNSSFKESSELHETFRSGVDFVGPLVFATGSPGAKKKVYEDAQNYAIAKYGEEMGSHPEVIDAILENAGIISDDDPRFAQAIQDRDERNANATPFPVGQEVVDRKNAEVLERLAAQDEANKAKNSSNFVEDIGQSLRDSAPDWLKNLTGTS